MSADARLLVDLDLGPAHRSRLTAASELSYFIYCRIVYDDQLDDTHVTAPLPLYPKRRYELALVRLETYHSIPNITEANNTFVYSPNNGTTWKTITLSEGSYEMAQINAAIQRQLEVNGDWNSNGQIHYITVRANPSTLRAFIEITSTYHSIPNSLLRQRWQRLLKRLPRLRSG